MQYPRDLLDHYQHPRHRGLLAEPHGQGTARNPLCGDEVTVHVRVAPEDASVVAASFEGVGCAISLGTADLLASEAVGRPTGDVVAWDEPWVHARIGLVPPPGRRRCASLALEAMQQALSHLHPPQGK